jgi:hypothetical protein
LPRRESTGKGEVAMANLSQMVVETGLKHRAKRRMHAKEECLDKVAITVELTHEYTVDEIEAPV